MKEQNVEKLFRDTFSNFEADVNPSVWANVEQGLPASPQNGPGSSPAKPSGFFGKMYLSTIALVVVISAALTGTILYLSSEKSVSKDVVAQNAQMQSQPSEVIVTPSSAPTVNAAGNHPVTETKNIAVEKQAANKTGEKAIANKSSVQAPAETKTANTHSTNSVIIPAEENSSVQPVASQENVTGGNGKVSVSPTQHSRQETNKSYTPPSTEASAGVSSGSSAHGVPAEEILPAEYKEEFHFYIPNVFTPNGDMVNDYFTPIAGGNNLVKDYELIIFDRYGFELFRTNDISVWWDGKLKNGDMAAEAVYVYKIKLTDFKGEEHDYIGYVALLKGRGRE
jgi:gliding motility-associated-like protein